MFDLKLIKTVYAGMAARMPKIRQAIGRPLTLTEKILYSHLYTDDVCDFKRNADYADFAPDRVAMQDATAQMALLQFMNAGKPATAVPTTVHCDHLVKARTGGPQDLAAALTANREVYDFLASVANKYGIGFWKPGAGIIHQVVLENYAFPGGMMIGTDSHTVNAGGLGMVAIGVGGADAVDVMAGLPWELRFPKLLGIRLTGKLNGWTAPKDIILKVAGLLSVKGGTGYVIEYFGDGALTLSATGKATICNMGAEVGATTSIFGYDAAMERYLQATGRAEVATLAALVRHHLTADPEVYENPEQYFDHTLEINLDELEPYINGPFTPDRAIPISQMKAEAAKNNWPTRIDVGLIGSCTNSSYEDITRAAAVARQAIEKDIAPQAALTITPGSEQVRYTIERDGLVKVFSEIGADVFANACGPCIGQWERPDADKALPNTIVHSFNRNFAKRADGNPNTHAFVASPETVVALAIAGDLTFNPLTDPLLTRSGQQMWLTPPTGEELPPHGFAVEDNGYQAPAADGSAVTVHIAPDSKRLQLLAPFPAWDGHNIENARLLIKVQGKCTTDHISMAGPWLKFRGHLEQISNNMLIGAVNAFNGQTNSVKNQLAGCYGAVPDAQRAYKAAGIPTVVVGDHNYGEGSSREHAAMEPRFLGVRAIIAKSFARIHETNLKKQGMLALTFANEHDYDKIREDDSFDFPDLTEFAPQRQLHLLIRHIDSTSDNIALNHTFNDQQISWFRAGSALNEAGKKHKTV